MIPFDHLSIFVSIIIALGVRHLILSAVSMIQLRGKVALFYPTLVWMVTLLLLQMQIWWAFFHRHNITDWRFFGFLWYLSIPIIVSMLSHLLLPELKPDSDLKEIYSRNRKWFFGLFAVVIILSLVEDFIFFGNSVLNPNTWLRIIAILILAVGFFSGSKRVQLPLSLAFLCLLLIYISWLFIRLT